MDITVSETQSTAPAAAEGDTTAGNEADVSHLTATQANPAAPAGESAEETARASLPASNVEVKDPIPSVSRSHSSVPRLSQIEDIPDMSGLQTDARASASMRSNIEQHSAVEREDAGQTSSSEDDSSINMIPETQYPAQSLAHRVETVADGQETVEAEAAEAETPADSRLAETQTTRIDESFNESMLPRRIASVPPRKSLTPEVIVFGPKKAAALAAPQKGKGRIIKLPTPSDSDDSDSDDGFTLVATSRNSRSSLGSTSNTSRVSNTSNESSRISNRSFVRDTSHIEVVIPYKAHIPRPWKDDLSPPRKVSKPKARSSVIEKRKYTSSNASNVLKQVNSTGFVMPRGKSVVQGPASAFLTVTKNPSGILRTTSLPTILHDLIPEHAGQAEDGEGGDDKVVSSSPENCSTRVKDASDSLLLFRKRKLQHQAEVEPASSSPTIAAHRRRSSHSQSGRVASGRERPSPPSTCKRSIVSAQDVVDSLCEASEHELSSLFNRLPHQQQKLMHKLLSDALRQPKKARHA